MPSFTTQRTLLHPTSPSLPSQPPYLASSHLPMLATVSLPHSIPTTLPSFPTLPPPPLNGNLNTVFG
ncbi:hypothetical protein HYC85_007009 [Camellia sinensis]|uniref:Uncharacterized protein n=1 Tax=Camellia sinensis TaxID=4442 RepID=A0A7J7HMR4_CAMSI|nr:hypothetical protein HYC85_007009 [Camellia sinensis]